MPWIQTGIMVEFSYLACSAKVGATDTNVKLTIGRLLHLRRRSPRRFAKREPTVIHVTE